MQKNENVQKDKTAEKKDLTQNGKNGAAQQKGTSQNDDQSKKHDHRNDSNRGEQSQKDQNKNKQNGSSHNSKNQKDDSEIETPGKLREDDDATNTEKKMPQMSRSDKNKF
jgi:hypothetical protein